MENIRECEYAGRWYLKEADELRQQLELWSEQITME